MKLTTSNATVTNTVVSSKLTIGNASVVESLSIGNVSINSSAIAVGNVLITPAAVSTPSLILGGTAFSGGLFGGIVDYQEFTANGTWNNPYANASANAALTGYEQVLVMAWGGGGGGSGNGGLSTSYAGGGGACVIGTYQLSGIPNTISVYVGPGGNNRYGAAAPTVAGYPGGNSTFHTLVAYGGTGFGGGAGVLSSGANGAGGSPLPSNTSTYGGGLPANSTANAGTSIFGGGGGTISSGALARIGGNTIFGGGGGGGSTSGSLGGISVFGGSGGNGSVAASPPGGGGGALSGDGARGEVRVWVIGPGSTTAGAPTYTLTANTTTLYEGSDVLYTVSTTNVANNTTLYYTLNNSSTATSTDFTTAVNGSIVISGGTGTFTLTANADTDSANEAFQIDVRTSNSTGSIVASNGSVSIIPSAYLTYVGTYSNTSPSSKVFGFNNISIGTVSSSREIIIVAMAVTDPAGAANGTMPGITVDGVSANLSTSSNTSFSSSSVTRSAVISKPTGTTANISITTTDDGSPAYNACLISVYQLIGRSSTSNNAAVDAAFFGGQNANTTTTTVDINIGDNITAAIRMQGTGANISAVYPGYIEDYDASLLTDNTLGFYHINVASTANSSNHAFNGSINGNYNLGGVWVYR